MYSTDASAYREAPEGVLFPKSREELCEIVNMAAREEKAIIPRGAGTSLAGQVVGSGIVVDTSRFLNKIIEINVAERWARVEPGVILDELNIEAAKYGLFFAPETSTSNRCCIGGMVGNNSCGSHSLIYGSTRDHLLEAEVILSDGSFAAFKEFSEEAVREKIELDNLEGDIYRYIVQMAADDKLCVEIERNFPDRAVRRRNTGYALDELLEKYSPILSSIVSNSDYRSSNYNYLSNDSDSCGKYVDNSLQSDNLCSQENADRIRGRIGGAYKSLNLCKLLAGSEGTLAVISELKVNLIPKPSEDKILLCAHCATYEDAFQANLIALKYRPAAVELMDRNILELSKSNISQNKNRFFINGEPAAILIIEFYSGDHCTDPNLNGSTERHNICGVVADVGNEALHSVDIKEIVAATETELLSSGLCYFCSKVEGYDISRVWALRKAGLGLMSSMKGDAKPVSVVEDTAVAPERLPVYLAEFKEMLAGHGLDCVYHAHIGSGELHLRPILNLKKGADVDLFRTVARETALLVKKHRGSLSGEHGDGRLRGEFIPLMFGEQVYGAMKRLKSVFDPNGILNPGKIIDTPPMSSSLRYVPDRVEPIYKTYFDSTAMGGWLRAIEQCNGSGDCRKSYLFGGTMCPSFRLTGREQDSTRGRSNVLRELLTNPQTEKIFDQQEIIEALDLCVSCKACKSECPSSVDMARYKAEFTQHHYDISVPPFRSFMVSRMASIQRIGSIVPGLYNFFASNRFSSAILKKILKFTPQRAIPKLSKVTLRSYAAKCSRRTRRNGDSNSIMKSSEKDSCSQTGVGRRLYLFADEFTNYLDAEVGIDFMELLTALGYEVIVPKHCESGRAAISKGFLKRAKRLADKNVALLKDIVTSDAPLVGIEPSTILSFRDEYPDLVGDELKEEAKELSKNALLYDEFIMREVEAGRISAEMFTDKPLNIVLHGHCHQKSLASVEPSAKMLSLPVNYKVKQLSTGCCGMAGSFGFEKEHYEVSLGIGEQVLLPLVREADAETVISAPGTSCRQQIFEGTGRKAEHPITILKKAL